MSAVYTCLVEQHQSWLLALALAICTLSSLTAVHLMGRAKAGEGAFRHAWLVAAAVVTGSGIWATHFIAMLAYHPGLPIGFDLPLTLASVVVAIAVTGLGLLVYVSWSGRYAALLAGCLFGSGIGAMHFTGMLALRVPANFSFDPGLAAAAWVQGILLSAAALHFAKDCDTTGRRLIAAGLLVAAIVALHFTAMGALTFEPYPTFVFEEEELSRGPLAIIISGVTLVILLLGFIAAIFDRYLAERSSMEARRLADLANASAEGIVICRDGFIVDANRSFLLMAQQEWSELRGKAIIGLVGSRCYAQLLRGLAQGSEAALESTLRRADAPSIPIELMLREMNLNRGRHQVFSLHDLSERKHAEARIEHLAHHDALTNLPNRPLFASRLEQEIARARRTQEKLAVLCLDLDHFKEVNDLVGHTTGDALLFQVAGRLQETVRDTDTVARFGGDEFGVVQVGLAQPEAAGALAQRLIDRLGGKYAAQGCETLSGVSIGIAVFPNDGTDVDTLLRNADTALFRAKDDGRGNYRFFEAAMDERQRNRRLLEKDLRLAVDRGELRLAFQPQARVQTGEITGFEVLLRWRHPIQGDISPGVFIPLAEQCGLIEQIGDWVLSQACLEAASWTNPLKISVNLSPLQFHNDDLAKDVETVLGATGLSADRLELEITEGVLLKDKDRALKILRCLKSLGVRIAMDDFGTGYSSLSYLQSFPFDTLKIDRSFVMNLEEREQSRTIVRAIIGLGRGLHLPVVAEGVETQEQLDLLRRESCDEMQGYLIGKPLPIEAYAAIVGAVSSDYGTDEPESRRAIAV